MPTLVRLFIVNTAIGFALSAVFVFLLMWFNVSGLADQVVGSADGVLGLGLIWVLNGMLFGTVQIAYVVMTSHND